MVFAASAGSVAATDTRAQYPDLPPAKNYTHVADIAVDTVSKKWKLTQQQKAAALAFILHRYPVRVFEKMSLADSALLIRGRTDAAVRRTAAYRRDLDGCNLVSQQMAIIIVKDALHTYHRKVVSPDPLTQPLFASTSDRQTEDDIAAIQREVSRDEFLRSTTSKFPIRPGDRFYFYTTSFGGGYLIARAGKVIKDEGAFEY
jgi:hypothetical protein